MTTKTPGCVVVGGSFAAFILVAGFGNQWILEDLLTRDEADENSVSHVLAWLSTPHWVVDTSGVFEHVGGRSIAGCLVGVLALLLTVAFVLRAAARRGDFNAFICGWFSMVLGGAAYALTSYLISGGGTLATHTTTAIDGGGTDPTLAGTLNAVATGGGYGLISGWFVAVVCAFLAAGGDMRALFRAPSPPMPAPPAFPPGDDRHRRN
jgi:hypothetical protein